MHPYPRRFGGGKPLLQTIHDSLNAQRGTSVDATNPATIVWLENHAIARAITFDGWGANQRLSHQWDPDRLTDMLPRWEGIMKLTVSFGATDRARRAAVKERFARFGQVPTHATIVTAIAAAAGAAFVAVEYIPRATAVIHVPDGSYPWGTVVPGIRWYSTAARILVRLDKPAGWTEGDFYEAAGKVVRFADPILPSWATIDWYRGPDAGATPVTGGPSAAGFYLDTEHNLDNQVFD